MKKCSYCDNVCNNSAAKCPQCGGNSFIFICSNCGSPAARGNYCAVCGTRFGDEGKTCPRCGKRYFSRFCPDCGSGSEKNPVAETKQPQTYSKRVNTEKKKGNHAGAWFGSIFIIFAVMVYFPSVSSLLFLLSLFFTLPFDRLIAYRRNLFKDGKVRGFILAVLLIGAVMLTQ